MKSCWIAAQGMLGFITSVPDNVYTKRYHWIDGNSAAHYAEHAELLQAWRDRIVGTA